MLWLIILIVIAVLALAIQKARKEEKIMATGTDAERGRTTQPSVREGPLLCHALDEEGKGR